MGVNAMKQTVKAILSLTLSLVLCTALTLNAVAAEPVITGGGTSQTDPMVTITVTPSTDPSGNQVSTETTQTQWSDKDSEGFGTTYDQTVSTTTVTGQSGTVLSKEGFTQGSETSTREEMPDLSLPLEEGKQTSATSELKDSTTGKLQKDDPNNYDQATTTVEQQRQVTADTGEQKITVGSGQDSAQTELGPILPEWTGTEQDITGPRPDRFGQNDSTGPNGYDFRYTGWGQDSHYGAYHHTTTFDPETQTPSSTTEEADITQFLLTDTNNPDGPDHTAYCADLCTGVKEGWWYRIDNLENAGYYTDPSAADHIRAIACNGYWGTAAGQTGSLESFVALMKDAQQNGDAAAKALLAGFDFDQMTEGEAQAATQMAIWQYGHRVSPDAALELEASNFNGSYGWSEEEGDAEAWARINAAAGYLATLSQPAGNTTQIITEEKFIESMALTIKERLDGSQGNTNDRYAAELCFTLVVTPGEKDSLTVQVVQDGRVVATQNILPGQREYTIQNLSLAENSDVNFNLEMTGVQYLEQGVYLYTSEVRNESQSQTFVGLAEGNKAVDLNMDVTLRFDVTDAVVSTQRIWRSQWSSNNTPTYTPTTTPDEQSKPTPTLAEVPKTGDSLSLWAALTLLGGLGLLVPAKKRTAQQ